MERGNTTKNEEKKGHRQKKGKWPNSKTFTPF